MSRLLMPSALPAEYAERESDCEEPYSPAEEAAIERRADEIIAEKISHGDLTDLFDRLPSIAFVPELQRALRNMDTASAGHIFAYSAVYISLKSIQRTVRKEAERLWHEDAREQAERELAEGSLT